MDEVSGAQSQHDKINAHLQAMDMPRAFEAAHQALAAVHGPTELAGARYWLAKCHYVAGAIDSAIKLAAEACTAASQAQEPIWLARAQTIEARCLDSAGESHAALDLVLMALQALERTGRTDAEAHAAQQAAVTALGVVYLRLGDLPLAMQWCQRSLELARSLPDQAAFGAATDTVACVHAALAATHREAGDLAEAERCERMAIACSSEAVAIAQGLGHVDYETSALLNLAESLTLVGEASRALALLEDWARRHPRALPRQWSHQRDSLGQVYMAMDKPEQAVAAFEAALAPCESEVSRALITEHLSAALERCGRWQEALVHYKTFHALQSHISAERAQRSARVAAVRLDIEHERARARQLASSNTELLRRAEDLARQAGEDALTGLANRRQIDSLLAARPQSMSIALVDVDHFKRVNDRFSHAVGDRVLQQLASIMRGNCRPRDIAARLGGEEFLLMFDGSPDADVARAAQRLRGAVETFDWESIAHGLRVTVSIGLASAAEGLTGGDLLAVADRRLYAAKRAGRNRVVGAG